MADDGHPPKGPHGPVWFALGGFIAVCFAVAALGGAVTATSVGTWYQTLDKPAFTPPDWVFAPVWNALYMMMALGGFLVWRVSAGAERRAALLLFGAQLALNFAWSYLFFGVNAVGAAFIESIVLWLAVAATTFLFWRVDVRAGLLFLPYLMWSGFAAVLTGAIWRLN
jgi:tryptophan-rich sensory protein